MDSANMTHAEHFKLNGTLTPERIEALLAELDEVPDAESISDLLTEAATGFPDEDFLDDAIDDLERAIAEGDLDALDSALKGLQAKALKMKQSAEHGIEQLDRAQDILGWRA